MIQTAVFLTETNRALPNRSPGKRHENANRSNDPLGRCILPGFDLLRRLSANECSVARRQQGDRFRRAAARVATVKPQRKALERRSEQPGEIAAFEQTPLYAKVAGYVQAVNVDIGDKIKQGQPLAVLSVPELVEEAKQKTALVRERSRYHPSQCSGGSGPAAIESATARVAARKRR